MSGALPDELPGSHVTRVDDDDGGSVASCAGCDWTVRVDAADPRIAVDDSHPEAPARRRRAARMRAHFAAYSHRMARR